MSSMSREGKLNSRLTECQQIYERLGGVGANLANLNLTEIPQDRCLLFAREFLDLLSAMDAVEHLLKQVRLDGAIQNVAPQPLKIYRDKIAPNRKRFVLLIIELFDLSDEEPDPDEFRPDQRGSPVWNILASGLDFWGIDKSGRFSEEELKDTDRLVYSSFFRPDEWLGNADEIEPVMGRAAEQRIPINIRVRLKELYRSFILGNYLSAIALARAVLEYALVDRSGQIGINPFSDDPRHPARIRKLGTLVDDAAENRPELRSHMESILDAGNKTLHPKKKDKLVLLPLALRELALTSINAVRIVVEDLYLEK
jgi:hypothetical protein